MPTKVSLLEMMNMVFEMTMDMMPTNLDTAGPRKH